MATGEVPGLASGFFVNGWQETIIAVDANQRPYTTISEAEAAGREEIDKYAGLIAAGTLKPSEAMEEMGYKRTLESKTIEKMRTNYVAFAPSPEDQTVLDQLKSLIEAGEIDMTQASDAFRTHIEMARLHTVADMFQKPE